MRISARRELIISVAAMMLVMLTAVDFVTAFWSTALPPTVAEQAALTGGFTIAGVFESLVGLAAGGVALLLARRPSAGRRLSWVIIGGCCIAAGLADLFIAHPSSLAFAAVMVVLASMAMGLIVRCVWSVPGALPLVAIGAALLASNPVTEAVEINIAGDSSNYQYIAADEPYALTSSAWRRLWIASRFQENGEAIAMILLLQSFLLAGACSSARRAPGAASQHEAAPLAQDRGDGRA